MSKYKVVSKRLWKGQQSRNLKLLAEMRDGTVVQVNVKRDSYDFQSSAVAKVWTEEKGWVVVASIPYPLMAAVKVSDNYLSMPDHSLVTDAYALLDEALRALGTER